MYKKMVLSKRTHRVTAGGVFNLPRVQYSQETQDLLKVMMEECKLSMMKRKELSKFITNGDSLPTLKSQPSKSQKSTVELKIQPAVCKKRPKDKIIEMGAYERDKIKTLHKADSGEEKKRLQNLMAYGTLVPQNSDRAGRIPLRKNPSPTSSKDRFEELVQEVRERCQFLQDVTELGQADKYQTIMQAEIATKLNAMRAIDPARCEEVRRELRLPTKSKKTSEMTLALR